MPSSHTRPRNVTRSISRMGRGGRAATTSDRVSVSPWLSVTVSVTV